MKHCIYCNTLIPDEAKFCSKCGKMQDGERKSGEVKSGKKKIVIMVLAIVIAAAVVTTLIFTIGGKDSKSKGASSKNGPKQSEKSVESKEEKKEVAKEEEPAEVEIVSLPAVDRGKRPSEAIYNSFFGGPGNELYNEIGEAFYDLTGDRIPERLSKYHYSEGGYIYFVQTYSNEHPEYSTTLMKMRGDETEQLFIYDNKLYALFTYPDKQSIYRLEPDPNGDDHSIATTHIATSSAEPGKTNVFKIAEIPVDMVMNLGM